MSAAVSRRLDEPAPPTVVRQKASSAEDQARERAREAVRLIDRVAVGDELAFGALYDAFSRPAYGLALRILREPGRAEDAVQEAFLTVWRTAHLFRAERGSAAAWILTLVHRRAVDAVRREERRRPEVLDDAVEGPSGSPDADAIDRDRVRAAVAGLERRERDVIALAYYGGLTQSQIAAQLGTAIGTVKSRTSSGLKRLERALVAA